MADIKLGRWHNETHQILFEKVWGDEGCIIEGVNLFKGQNMHPWNYHKESPLND
jgi:hypothetical protein